MLRLLLLAGIALLPRPAPAKDHSLFDEKLGPLPDAASLGLAPASSPFPTSTEPPRSWRGEGSASALRGIVCVQHIFVHTPDAPWSEELRAQARSAGTRGTDYLRRQAARRGIELRWREQESDFHSAEEVSPRAADHSWTTAAVRSAITPLGLFLPVARCERKQCDQRLAILHSAQEGRSYALPSLISYDSELERAVLFLRSRRSASSWSDSQSENARVLRAERPAAFAHEILHLFGAEDFYQPEARKREARARYPRDIMLQSHRDLDDLEIGAHTAHRVGWREDEPAPLAWQPDLPVVPVVPTTMRRTRLGFGDL